MKLSVGVLLALTVAVHGAAIDSGFGAQNERSIIPDSLFESAWEYQRYFESLQEDINIKLNSVRTEVSDLLQKSSTFTLEQIEGNANSILLLDDPARNRIYELSSSLCVNNLRVLINGITEFTGFGSSNCVTSYDISVQEAINTTYALLKKYEGPSVDVQQIVVRSFINRNAFLQPEEIENRFKDIYNQQLAEWNEFNPDTEDFLSDLRSKIDDFFNNLKKCFNNIQESVAPAYDILQGEIATCEAFDSTPDPFAIFYAKLEI